jgi:uncharacterized damage-inducible protein DinB
MTEDASGRLFLEFSSRKLQQLAGRVDICLAKLSDEQIWARNGDHENAVGNLVLHLCGNVRQWITSSIGGAPDSRRRAEEFSARGNVGGKELRERLQATVNQATTVMAAINTKRLSDRLIIQGMEVSVLAAIYHVVEHFAMHTGQIIFITKTRTGLPMDFSQDSRLEQLAP